MDWNKQRGSKWTKYKYVPTDVTFGTHWKMSMFPERSIRVLAEVENVNLRHSFDIFFVVIAKCGNGREEIAGGWQNNSLCQTYVSLVLYVKFRTEKHCLVKHFAVLKNFWNHALSLQLLVFLWAADLGPQPTFLEGKCYLPVSNQSTLSRWPWLQ